MSILAKQLTKATIKQHITLDVSSFMLDGSSSSELYSDLYFLNLYYLAISTTKHTDLDFFSG